jgi:hypothetical protein
LLQTINWAFAAWAAWCWLLVADYWPAAEPGLAGYVALCLTGCAGVAVLGARRPVVTAWNFVVLGLLVVLLLPLFESRLAGQEMKWDLLRTLFLVGTLGVAVVNYLATRLAPAALLLAVAAGGDMTELARASTGGPSPEPLGVLGRLALVLAPWLAYVLHRGRRSVPSEFDRLWFDFRDRFGLVWGQRLREQFNRAAANAGWPVYLRWQGLRILPGSPRPDAETQKEILLVLRALLKRFGPEE